MERPIKMIMALLLLAVLAVVLVHALLPYINAFLGAFILYVLLRPVYQFMIRRGRLPKKSFSSFVHCHILSSYIGAYVFPHLNYSDGITKCLGICRLSSYVR